VKMEAELHSHFPLVHRLTHARTEPILIPRLQLQGLIALAFGFLSSIKAGACNGMIPTTPSTGSQRFTPGTKFQLPANYNKGEPLQISPKLLSFCQSQLFNQPVLVIKIQKKTFSSHFKSVGIQRLWSRVSRIGH